MLGASNLRDWNVWLLGLWLAALVILFCKPPNTPPSAPAGVGLARGQPVYAHPPVSYEERFSQEALGPVIVEPPSPLGDWAYFDALSMGCPVSRAAVKAQGVGE